MPFDAAQVIVCCLGVSRCACHMPSSSASSADDSGCSITPLHHLIVSNACAPGLALLLAEITAACPVQLALFPRP